MAILLGAPHRDAGTITHSGLIGFWAQEPMSYERLTRDEHFELFGPAYRMSDPDIDRSTDGIDTTLDFAERHAAQVEGLPRSTRTKLKLGLTLLSDLQLLLVDEPYAVFDCTHQRFWQPTHDRRQSGRSLLIISHFITDAVCVLVDAAFASRFDETGDAMLALGSLAAITVAAGVVFYRIASPGRAARGATT